MTVNDLKDLKNGSAVRLIHAPGVPWLPPLGTVGTVVGESGVCVYVEWPVKVTVNGGQTYRSYVSPNRIELVADAPTDDTAKTPTFEELTGFKEE